MKTIELEYATVYIHTAHDDELYFHALSFAKNEAKTNIVRLALVYRWLAVSAYFRQDSNDHIGNRYSMVDKHAFEKLDQRKKDKESVMIPC